MLRVDDSWGKKFYGQVLKKRSTATLRALEVRKPVFVDHWLLLNRRASSTAVLGCPDYTGRDLGCHLRPRLQAVIEEFYLGLPHMVLSKLPSSLAQGRDL